MAVSGLTQDWSEPNKKRDCLGISVYKELGWQLEINRKAEQCFVKYHFFLGKVKSKTWDAYKFIINVWKGTENKHICVDSQTIL